MMDILMLLGIGILSIGAMGLIRWCGQVISEGSGER